MVRGQLQRTAGGYEARPCATTVARCCFVSRVFSLPLLLSLSLLPLSECVEVRNAVFKSEAPVLSLESARAAIDHWGGDKADITHVVAVTCTGVIVPGLEFSVSA